MNEWLEVMSDQQAKINTKMIQDRALLFNILQVISDLDYF